MKAALKKSNKIKGSILPLAVMMVLLVSLLGYGLIRLGHNARVQAAKMVAELSARAAADAGVARAVHQMNEKLASEPVWDNSTLPSASNVGLEGSEGKYTFDVAGDPFAGFTVNSIGVSGFALRKVHATLDKESLWFGIGVKEGIDLKFGTSFSVEPSGSYFSIRTNSTEDNAITVKSGVTIPGDLIVGPGGETDEVVNIKSSTVIEGDTWAAKDEIDFPPVIPPDLGPAQGSITGRDYFVIVDSPVYDSNGTPQLPVIAPHPGIPPVPGNAIVLDDGAYNSIDVGQGSTILIVGDATLYIDGPTILGQDTSMIVVPSSSLNLYLGGDMEAKNSNGLDNLNTDPRALLIYGTDACQNIDLKAKGDVFFGAVYAPEADLDVYAKNEIAGGFIGKSFEMKNATHFTFVASLYDTGINEPQAYLVQRWWEE